jgi:hypothetical protein
MKLTIIIPDGAVYEDGLCYSGLTWDGTPANIHALQWQNVVGWLEFNDGTANEEITSLPVWADNAMAAWSVADSNAKHPPAPLPPTAEQNASTASSLLYQTDWSTIADVADPTKSNPYLTNVNDYLTYRNAVRQYIIKPVAGVIDWPTPPKAIWS